MQSLTTDDLQKQYDLAQELPRLAQQQETQKLLRQALTLTPEPVKVTVDPNDETVNLSIGQQPALVLSIGQARDLAHALRKAADRLTQARFQAVSARRKAKKEKRKQS